MAPPRLPRTERKCLGCDTTFPVIPSTRKRWCSKSCAAINGPLREGLETGRRSHKPGLTGADCPNWKGNDVGYSALHTYISRHFLDPGHCELCGTTVPDVPRLEWAQKVPGSTSRNRTDWFRLCPRCHMRFDGRKLNWKAGYAVRLAKYGAEGMREMAREAGRKGAAARWGKSA